MTTIFTNHQQAGRLRQWLKATGRPVPGPGGYVALGPADQRRFESWLKRQPATPQPAARPKLTERDAFEKNRPPSKVQDQPKQSYKEVLDQAEQDDRQRRKYLGDPGKLHWQPSEPAAGGWWPQGDQRRPAGLA